MRFLENIEKNKLSDRIAAEGAVVIHRALARHTVEMLLAEALNLEWRKAVEFVSASKVEQDYWVAGTLATESSFRLLAAETANWINGWGAADFGGATLRFNEMRVQRYEANSFGITPHRDGLWCKMVIGLFILEDGGRFGLCDDRTEAKEPINARALQMSAGDLVLMRAPGFRGENTQPMHFVDNVRTRRITYGLRYVP
jgi:hypothetical protein